MIWETWKMKTKTFIEDEDDKDDITTRIDRD